MTNLIILFIFVPILAVILLSLNLFLASHKPDEAKNSSYECGYDSIHGQTRTKFHIHFFVIALLFLLFDLEIVLLLPLATSLQYVGLYGFTVALIFFGILTIGFVFEIGTGAIKLSNLKSKSNSEPNQINQSENKTFDNKDQIIGNINVNKTTIKNKYNYNNSLSNSIMFNKQNTNFNTMHLQKSNFHSSALLSSENGNGNRKSFWDVVFTPTPTVNPQPLTNNQPIAGPGLSQTPIYPNTPDNIYSPLPQVNSVPLPQPQAQQQNVQQHSTWLPAILPREGRSNHPHSGIWLSTPNQNPNPEQNNQQSSGSDSLFPLAPVQPHPQRETMAQEHLPQIPAPTVIRPGNFFNHMEIPSRPGSAMSVQSSDSETSPNITFNSTVLEAKQLSKEQYVNVLNNNMNEGDWPIFEALRFLPDWLKLGNGQSYVVVACSNKINEENLPKSNNEELCDSITKISSEAKYSNIVASKLYESWTHKQGDMVEVLENLRIGSSPSTILSLLNRNNNNSVNAGIFSVPNNSSSSYSSSNNGNNNSFNSGNFSTPNNSNFNSNNGDNMNQKIIIEDIKTIKFENTTEKINLNDQNELFSLKFYNLLNETHIDFLQSLFNLIPFLYSFLTLIFSIIIVYYPLKESFKLIYFYYKYK